MTRNGVPNSRAVKRDLTQGGRPIQHGKWVSYSYHKCGCGECREAYRLYAKRRREGRGKPLLVPAVGSTRRLRGLAVMGHSMVTIAAETGLHTSHVYGICAGRLQWVHVDTAAKITAVYRRLSSVIPTGPQAGRVRNASVRKGWVSVADWRDIDDPAEAQESSPDAVDMEPDNEIVRRLLAGIKTPARKVDKDAAFLSMLEAGKTDTWISERLGMNALTVKKRRAAVEAERKTDTEEAA